MTSLYEVQAQLSAADRAVQQRIGEARARKYQVEALTERLEEQEEAFTALSEALGTAAAMLAQREDSSQRMVESVVTAGLQSVFGDDTMELVLERTTRGKTAAIDILVQSSGPGGEVLRTPVLGARGGGVAAVVGFLLRLSLLLLSGARRFMVLDETFAQLSAEYEPRMAEFLRDLADRSGVEFLLVTHSSAFNDVADRVYKTRLVGGATTIEVV